MIPTSIIRLTLLITVMCGAALPTTPSRAASFIDEIRIGLLYHDLGVWSDSSSEQGIDYNAELIFSPSWPLLGGTIRPVAGFSLNGGGGTSKVYGSAVFEYIWNNGMFIDLGFGLAIHNGEIDGQQTADNNLLGSPVLFRVSIESGFAFTNHHRVSLMFDHVSNGYLADPNEGLDTLGIRYGYRF